MITFIRNHLFELQLPFTKKIEINPNFSPSLLARLSLRVFFLSIHLHPPFSCFLYIVKVQPSRRYKRRRSQTNFHWLSRLKKRKNETFVRFTHFWKIAVLSRGLNARVPKGRPEERYVGANEEESRMPRGATKLRLGPARSARNRRWSETVPRTVRAPPRQTAKLYTYDAYTYIYTGG